MSPSPRDRKRKRERASSDAPAADSPARADAPDKAAEPAAPSRPRLDHPRMTPLERAKLMAPRAVWPILLALLCVHLAGNASPQAAIQSSLAFTALILMAFIGWGSLAAYAFAKDTASDIGLRAAWGMAILMGIGGFLVVIGAASRGPLAVLLLVGVVLFCWHASLEDPKAMAKRLAARVRENPGFYLALGVVAVVLLLQCICSVFDPPAVADDGPAYSVFPKQLVDSGTFDQPFSFRRMSSLGGQSFLQAFFLLNVRPEHLAVFDRGLCSIMVILLLGGAPRERFRVPAVFIILPMLIVLTVENLRWNLASEMSGVVLIFALYRTLRWPPIEKAGRPIAAAALIAALGAGALMLRQNYAAPVIAMLVASYCVPLFAASDRPLRARLGELREGGYAAGFAFLLLLPWAIAAQRSCHSFAFPFISGNYSEGVGFESRRDFVGNLALLWDNITNTSPIVTIHVFVFAGLTLIDDTARRATRSLFIGSIVGLVALLWFSWFAKPQDFRHYYFSFEMALVCGLTVAAFEQTPSDSRPAAGLLGSWSAIVIVLASVFQLVMVLQPVHTELAAAFKYMSYDGRELHVAEDRAADDVYARLQAVVPPDAPIVAMLDEPFRLDFARNPIQILDLPGVASPAPGMPTNDPEAFAAYLDRLGVRYFAFVRSQDSKHLYSRATWERNKGKGWDGLPQQRMAPVVIEVIDEADQLSQTRAHLFDEAGMLVLDLAQKHESHEVREPPESSMPPPETSMQPSMQPPQSATPPLHATMPPPPH